VADVSILIPAYNEEENLPLLLDCLLAFLSKEDLDWEILVINDHSTDRTGEIAGSYAIRQEGINLIHRKDGKRGMGAALRVGTLRAEGDRIVWIMADRADDLSTIPHLLAKLDEGSDLVLSSRYMPGGSAGDLERTKMFLSREYNRMARILFSLPVHDITNAFRAFKRGCFLETAPAANSFAISPEFAIKAHLAGFRLEETPTTYSNRKAGKTKFNMLRMMGEYLSLFRLKAAYRKEPGARVG